MKTPGRKEKRSARKGSTANRSSATGFPIVGIGASAGGLEAFTELLKHLRTDTGLGFVLVQYLDPQHQSALTQILARATSLPVREVTDDLRVQPNHVHVILPNTILICARSEQCARSYHDVRGDVEGFGAGIGSNALGPY